jgi:hypothetical protein
MYVKLHQRRIADCFESVNLSGLDDKEQPSCEFSFVPIGDIGP